MREKRKLAAEPFAKERQTTRALWSSADVVIPDGKTRMTVRFDTDIVDWFKNQGPRYQTRMNAALRQYISSQGAQASAGQPTEQLMQALNGLGNICLLNGDLKGAAKHFNEVTKLFKDR